MFASAGNRVRVLGSEPDPEADVFGFSVTRDGTRVADAWAVEPLNPGRRKQEIRILE